MEKFWDTLGNILMYAALSSLILVICLAVYIKDQTNGLTSLYNGCLGVMVIVAALISLFSAYQIFIVKKREVIRKMIPTILLSIFGLAIGYLGKYLLF